jgi:DNA primase
MKRGWVDYRAVKAAVSMEMALANYGVLLQHVGGGCLRGRCPLPPHSSARSRVSFMVNTEKNAWVCHSDSCVGARGGQIGGNVLDFVAAMERCSVREAALKLQAWFTLPAPDVSPAPRRLQPGEGGDRDPSPAAANTALPFSLTRIDYSHPYLAKRGLDLDTARHFGIGYNRGEGSMGGRVVIPVHDENGFLVAYAGRSVDEARPKYRFPARFRKSLVLFNLHRAAAHGRTVVVVEGFFDCVKVHQAGIGCVVALMGCTLSARQEDLLAGHFHQAVLLMDGDRAGRSAGTAIGQRLVAKIAARIVEIPAGSQPDQLGSDQIRCLCIPGYF